MNEKIPFIFPTNLIQKLREIGFSDFGGYNRYTLTAVKSDEIWYFQYEPDWYTYFMTEYIGINKFKVIDFFGFKNQLDPIACNKTNFLYIQVRTKEWFLVSVEEFYNQCKNQIVNRPRLYN